MEWALYNINTIQYTIVYFYVKATSSKIALLVVTYRTDGWKSERDITMESKSDLEWI